MGARGTTTYDYDELNRLLYKTYSDTATVRACYAYDGFTMAWGDQPTNGNLIGHLTSSWSINHNGTVTAANEDYTFDPMGRLQAEKQCTPATCGASYYQTSAGYNLLGYEISFADPSTSRSTLYDTADRVNSFSASVPSLGSVPLLTVTQMGSVGMIQATLGNGLTETRAYTDRTWLGSICVQNATGTTCGSTPVYSLTGNNPNNPGMVYYAGNGNVLGANDSVNGNWTYSYDGVNRLLTATIGGQNFNYYYTADGSSGAYGNMTCTAPQQYACTPLGLSFSSSTNQITTSGYSYDAAGNLLSDNTHGYVYDLENRLTCVLGTDGTCTSASATNYYYDPQGNRVAKGQGDGFEGYVYDPQGHVVSAHNASTTLLRAELYLGARHVATYSNAGSYTGLFFNHADWLGTERARTSYPSASLSETCMDTPYGMNTNCVTSAQLDISPMHFAGLQYDYETGQFHTLNRQYPAGLGRWLTPDRDGGHPDDPQTLNRYAYVRNSPTALSDATGLDFYLTCIPTSQNAQTCQQVPNGSSTAWVQGATTTEGFVATVISNDGQGNLVDQNGNPFAGWFDQSGVHFSSEAGVGGNGQFKEGSKETDVFGTGIYLGTKGEFISACGGSCKARGSLNDLTAGAGFVQRAESFLNQRGAFTTALDRLSGAHDRGPQWMDPTGLDHVLYYNDPNSINYGKTEIHFEGNPVKGINTVPHLGNAFGDLISGRAAQQRSVVLP